MIRSCPVRLSTGASSSIRVSRAPAVLKSQVTDLAVRLGDQGAQCVAQLVKGVRLIVVGLDPRSDHACAQSGGGTGGWTATASVTVALTACEMPVSFSWLDTLRGRTAPTDDAYWSATPARY